MLLDRILTHIVNRISNTSYHYSTCLAVLPRWICLWCKTQLDNMRCGNFFECTAMTSPAHQRRKDRFHMYSLSPHLSQFPQSAVVTPLQSLWSTLSIACSAFDCQDHIQNFKTSMIYMPALPFTDVQTKRCCYIMVDTAKATSQNGCCSYKLSLDKKTIILCPD